MPQAFREGGEKHLLHTVPACVNFTIICRWCFKWAGFICDVDSRAVLQEQESLQAVSEVIECITGQVLVWWL